MASLEFINNNGIGLGQGKDIKLQNKNNSRIRKGADMIREE
jgi:hypothetical protein